jgi:hypothetical protein
LPISPAWFSATGGSRFPWHLALPERFICHGPMLASVFHWSLYLRFSTFLFEFWQMTSLLQGCRLSGFFLFRVKLLRRMAQRVFCKKRESCGVRQIGDCPSNAVQSIS